MSVLEDRSGRVLSGIKKFDGHVMTAVINKHRPDSKLRWHLRRCRSNTVDLEPVGPGGNQRCCVRLPD